VPYIEGVGKREKEKAVNDADWTAMTARMKKPDTTAFDKWMAKVDAVLVKKCGMDNRDLPDWAYADAFEDGFTPAAAARHALKAAKDEF
jgi:Family of unknown function (DUF5419)